MLLFFYMSPFADYSPFQAKSKVLVSMGCLCLLLMASFGRRECWSLFLKPWSLSFDLNDTFPNCLPDIIHLRNQSVFASALNWMHVVRVYLVGIFWFSCPFPLTTPRGLIYNISWAGQKLEGSIIQRTRVIIQAYFFLSGFDTKKWHCWISSLIFSMNPGHHQLY